jgi:hypothetical protein
MAKHSTKALKSEQLSAREIVKRSDEVLGHLIARAPTPHASHRAVSAKTESKAAGRHRKAVRRERRAPAS